MIVCPNCQHKEIPGTLFCSECGAQLVELEGIVTQNIQPTQTNHLQEQHYPLPPIIAPPVSEATVSLYIIEAGHILPLIGREEFTLGRAAEGQPVLPDIDLSSFRAYENGVSRLHTSIKVGEKQIAATDLGSVNGTLLNGKKIPPHKAFPLNHGDILTLGKLKVQILIRH